MTAAPEGVDVRSGGEAPASRPDGPEGGRWLWWNGKRYDVASGVVYRLIKYMWTRESASYDDLFDAQVFDKDVFPSTIRARASDVNREMKRIGVPLRLSTNSVNRYLTKDASKQD
jgi:hypothetical protein